MIIIPCPAVKKQSLLQNIYIKITNAKQNADKKKKRQSGIPFHLIICSAIISRL